MDTSALKKFAQSARRNLIQTVTNKLKFVLAEDSLPRRESPEAIELLLKQIQKYGKDAVIDQVAYTWFNRFCGLRFMDINGYNRIRIVSPIEGQTQPEILAEAKMGNIDETVSDSNRKKQIQGLLNGNIPSNDAQGELYRLLLVSACNDYYQTMPFLFQKIADYTELLLPDDLLSETSILAETREAMTQENCQDVEIIGWLYQYYISEKKDEVFAALKKNKKITPENIPAATQLFTPNWIVRYLVENSLGRLWMLNRPNSRLVEQMQYYISPLSTENDTSEPSLLRENDPPQPSLISRESKTEKSPKEDFLRIKKPEEIKILDPACGSGHILVYAFELLYAIYEEEGYQPSEIPEKILTHNLYGIDIDSRAGELAAFALTMKARKKYRRFFRKPVQPNICVLENVGFGVSSRKEKEGSGKGGNEQLWLIDSPQTPLISMESKTKGLSSSVRRESKTEGSSSLTKGELEEYMDFVGTDLFTSTLQETLKQFEEANNFGSLIRPRLTNVDAIIARLNEVDVSGQLFLYQTHEKVLQVLDYVRYLSPRYHLVIANPPFMSNKNMNESLSTYIKKYYPETKSNLYSAFIERILEITYKSGFIGLMTPFSWMFISSFEKLRQIILDHNTITTLVKPSYTAFFDSAIVSICAFVLHNYHNLIYKGYFIELDYLGNAEEQAPTFLQRKRDKQFYLVSGADFKKIPSQPIAYGVSNKVRNLFTELPSLEKIATPKQGLATANNDRFIKLWYEVSNNQIGFSFSNRNEAEKSGKKWFPYNKGGDFRKWYGNQEYIVNWENDGQEIRNFTDDKGKLRSRPQNTEYYFQESITWSFISDSYFAVRFSPQGFIFDVGGSSLFSDDYDLSWLNSLLCSKVALNFMKTMNPTVNFQVGNIANIPVIDQNQVSSAKDLGKKVINLTQKDWNSYETSWDFTTLPLLTVDSGQLTMDSKEEEKLPTTHYPLPTYPLTKTIAETYTNLRQQWAEMTLEMQKLEEENNRIFIEAYGLQEELTPEVPLKEITLTCNPHYRYDSSKPESELEALLLADTMKEFISYAVGCMFGRYSLDKEGLILANQGETIEDYLVKVGSGKWEVGSKEENICQFLPTKTNVIPILDGDWFSDDITEQFRQFLRVTFGEANYQTNLKFIEEAIDKKIGKYFQSDFYKDHVQRYKKRPIYWLFSSPKGSFSSLIYLHRYRSDTVSIVLNEYLREYRGKLEGKLEHLKQIEVSANVTSAEKTKAIKEITQLTKIVNELNEFDRTILYPLAIAKPEIDLDDGVKVNYPKFGKALKEIKGLEGKED